MVGILLLAILRSKRFGTVVRAPDGAQQDQCPEWVCSRSLKSISSNWMARSNRRARANESDLAQPAQTVLEYPSTARTEVAERGEQSGDPSERQGGKLRCKLGSGVRYLDTQDSPSH